MDRKLLALIALFCIGGFDLKVIASPPLKNQRPSSQWDPSQFVPLAYMMPGGQGVTYLSDLTKNLGDDMSSQIAFASQVVSAVGRSIEHRENDRSDEIQRVSDIVDSKYKDNEDDDYDGEEINEGPLYEEK